MNAPQIKNVQRAYQIYRTHMTLSIKDIMEIFDVGKTTAAILKSVAKKYEVSIGLAEYNESTVWTEEAFKAWGIDKNKLYERIKELEENDKNLFKK